MGNSVDTNKDHWAIIVESSFTVYTPGDQRSRDFPGHGYPEGYDTYKTINYEAFGDKEELQFRISQLHKQGKKFRVIKVTPVKWSIEAKVNITI